MNLIEYVFGISPDGGSGISEILIFLAVAAPLVLLGARVMAKPLKRSKAR